MCIKIVKEEECFTFVRLFFNVKLIAWCQATYFRKTSKAQ